MRRRVLISAGLGLALAAIMIVSRIEPLYLSWLAGKTPETTLDQRTLIADAVEVHVPDTDDGPFATVLMFHGCAGPRMIFQRQWAEVFTNAGYGAMIVDSTGPRGYDRAGALETVCAGKALIGQERAGDVFAAVEIARKDPRLDADRLILAGWSHGGWTVMDFLTMDGEKRRPAGVSNSLAPVPPVMGVILFYPHCGTGAWSKFRDWRSAPAIIAFVAGADEIVEPAKCQRLFRRKSRAGQAIDVTYYPDAHHVFDDPFLEPDWRHWYNEEDHEDAERRVSTFLKERLQ